jgi:hypothetical protein
MFGDVQGPLRFVVAFWFLLVCPGMALVPLMRLRDRIAEWTLAIALSLALDALVAGAMVFFGAWSPERGLIILVAVSLIGALLQVVSAQRRPVPRTE